MEVAKAPEYKSIITSKNVFTDKAAGFVGVIYIAIFLSAIIAKSMESLEKIFSSILSLNYTHFLFLAAIAISSYTIPLGILLLFRIFTKTMIWVNFALLITSILVGIYFSIINSNIIGGITSTLFLLIACGIFYAVVKDIKRIETVIKIACEVALRNISCYTVVFIAGVLTTFIVGIGSITFAVLSDIMQNSNKSFSLYKAGLILYTLFSTFFIWFSFNWGVSCLYGKATHQYMLNKVNSKKYHKSPLKVGVTRVILSLGTIFIAAALNSVISVLRVLANHFIDRTQNNRRGNAFLIIIGLIALLIVDLVLYILDVAARELNTYCIVYNSLFGTPYVTSMKRAVEHIFNPNYNKYRGLVGFCMFATCFLFCTGSLVISNLLFSHFLSGNITENNSTVNDLFLSLGILLHYMGGIIITYIITTSITAIEYISYADPRLLEKAFPKRSSLISSL